MYHRTPSNFKTQLKIHTREERTAGIAKIGKCVKYIVPSDKWYAMWKQHGIHMASPDITEITEISGASVMHASIPVG